MSVGSLFYYVSWEKVWETFLTDSIYEELTMIVTITMNPAIDKTVEIEGLVQGGLNRITRVEYDAGGKGINVSRTIRELGGSTVATGFLGGSSGKTIASVLADKGIQSDFVWVDGETRTNTKVFEKNGTLTELNEPGPVISEENLAELKRKLDIYAGEDTLFVLSGSVPAGTDKGIYADLIRHIHARGSRVLLDADGELFRRALPAGPDMIKPNRMELLEYAGLDAHASESDLLKIAEGFIREGIETVAVSMGKNGAMFLFGTYQVKCPGLSVVAHSTVGAGDAMVAALAYAWELGLDQEETVRLCMAVSAGAVTTIGTKPPKREVVEVLKSRVIIEEMEG